MIELTERHRLNHNEITSQVAEVKTAQIIGRKRIPKGQRLFVHDGTTKKVCEASYKHSLIDYESKQKQKQYVGQTGESYCFSINLQNAIRKFKINGLEVIEN